MTRRRLLGEPQHPADQPPMSDVERAEYQRDVLAGRLAEGPPQPPSRSLIGRIIDFFDGAAKAGRNGGL